MPPPAVLQRLGDCHRVRLCARAAAALLCLLVALAPAAPAAARGEARNALSLYAGVLTDEDWRKSVTGRADFVDSPIVAAAVSRTLFTAQSGRWSLEAEANAARHFGRQDHWEFNLPVAALRWHLFPGSAAVDASLAFGAGPSFATELPEAEQEIYSASQHVMLYWYLEAEAGPGHSPWALFLRLHHRSTAYGMFGPEGGGNVLTLGVRWRF